MIFLWEMTDFSGFQWNLVKFWFWEDTLMVNFDGQMMKNHLEIVRFVRVRTNRCFHIPSFFSNSFWVQRYVVFENLLFLGQKKANLGEEMILLFKVLGYVHAIVGGKVYFPPPKSNFRRFTSKDIKNIAFVENFLIVSKKIVLRVPDCYWGMKIHFEGDGIENHWNPWIWWRHNAKETCREIIPEWIFVN